MLICIYNEEIDLSCDETVLILEKIFILKILSLLLFFFFPFYDMQSLFLF